MHFLFQNFFLKLTCLPSDHVQTSALTFYVASHGWKTRDKVWLVTHVTAWLVHLCHRLHVLDCLCHRLHMRGCLCHRLHMRGCLCHRLHVLDCLCHRLHVLDCLCHRLHMLDCLRHCLHALMCDWFLHVFYASISMTLGNFLLVSK